MEDITTQKIKLQNMAVSIAIAELIEQSRLKIKSIKAKKHTIYQQKEQAYRKLETKVTEELQGWAEKLVIVQDTMFKKLSFHLFGSRNEIRDKITMNILFERPGCQVEIHQDITIEELTNMSESVREYIHLANLHKELQQELDNVDEEIADLGAMKNKYTKKIAIDTMQSTEEGKEALATAQQYVKEIQQELSKEKSGIATPLLA